MGGIGHLVCLQLGSHFQNRRIQFLDICCRHVDKLQLTSYNIEVRYKTTNGQQAKHRWKVKHPTLCIKYLL